MKRPLDGVRIIDLTRVLAGPFCTLILRDMGAEVIKVEGPEGDEGRAWPPLYKGKSLSFDVWNRGKKHVSMNLYSETAKELMRELVKVSDVVVENFRPGVMKDMGFDYDKLKLLNPSIVLTSISGFGQEGPWATRVANDPVAQALSGFMSITGFPDGPPVKAQQNMADYTLGMWAAMGTLGALYQKIATGEGQLVDVAMLDGFLAFMGVPMAQYLALGEVGQRVGNGNPFSVPNNLFKARDGYVYIAAGIDGLYNRLLQVMGRDDIRKSGVYANKLQRVDACVAVEKMVSDWAATHTVEEVCQKLEKAAVPFAPVYDTGQAATSEHTRAHEMMIEAQDPAAGPMPVTGTPIKFSGSKLGEVSAVPPPGAHNEEIFCGLLGHAAEELAKWKTEGIV
mgnify:CR=1 FL=1